MSYDATDVKSIQKFLGELKDITDKVNSAIPEDSDVKLDYDELTDKFYKANEGILKNRDTLKKEKLKVSNELEQKEKEMKDLHEKLGSIDENLPDEYNKVVNELSSLKEAMKDDKVDIDVINAKHKSEMEKLQADLDKQHQEQLKQIEKERDEIKTVADTYQNKYTDKLKREGLMSELERLNVNPEDRPLILQANLGRAEVSQTETGDFDVFFKTDNGETLPKSDFWNAWANDERNARYILAEGNAGGGASGTTTTKGTSKRDKLMKELERPDLPLKDRIRLSEEVAKL